MNTVKKDSDTIKSLNQLSPEEIKDLVEFIVQFLRNKKGVQYSPEKLQADIKAQFGLDIDLNVIRELVELAELELARELKLEPEPKPKGSRHGPK